MEFPFQFMWNKKDAICVVTNCSYILGEDHQLSIVQDKFDKTKLQDKFEVFYHSEISKESSVDLIT